MDCTCNFREKMVGDGCEVCNPAKALEYAKETIFPLEAHNDMLLEELGRLYQALKQTYSLSPEGRAEIDRIEKALQNIR